MVILPGFDANHETRLKRDAVIEFFGSKSAFEEFHCGMVDERKLSSVIVFSSKLARRRACDYNVCLLSLGA